jgi:CHAD domain-containing protein
MLMELDFGNIGKPVRQLRKSLKGLTGAPPAKDVHDLRTRTRRVEAAVEMVDGRRKKSKRHLLKLIKPQRKAAGAVRDMDVLTAKAHSLAGQSRIDSMALLLAHLQGRRIESACNLFELVGERRKDTRASLGSFLRQIEKHSDVREVGGSVPGGGGKPHCKTALKTALKLMNELSDWPAFNADNLHPFRIKVKELRYVLQLAGGAEPRFVAALDKVKARIGDWHDWLELRVIAQEVPGIGKKNIVLAKINEIEASTLKLALAAARLVMARFLGPHREIAAGEP